MTFSLVQNHRMSLAAPLNMPLKLLGQNGLFEMDRDGSSKTYNTTSGLTVSYQPHYAHTGLDLKEDEGQPVFAAASGTFVKMNQIGGDSNNLRMWIRHMEPGVSAFVTRYLHVKNPQIGVGGKVSQGDCIAEVGSVEGHQDQLHFETRLIMNPGRNDFENNNTEPVDPLPFLYRLENVYFEQIRHIFPSFQTAEYIHYAGVVRKRGIWMYEVEQQNNWYYIPLCFIDEGERQLVDLLQHAFFAKEKVRLASRQSPFFFDMNIVTKARVEIR